MFSDIQDTGPGGDVDTDNIMVTIPNGERLFIYGFDPENDPQNQSDCDVDMVVLTDGADSRGGLNVNDPDLGQAYIKIKQYLIDKGFEVVPTLDDYC
jgi:hypothetical protein